MFKNLLFFIEDVINTSKRSFHVFIILIFLLFLSYNFTKSVISDIHKKELINVEQKSISVTGTIEIIIHVRKINTNSDIIVKSYILLNPSLVQINTIKDYYKNNYKIINVNIIDKPSLLKE